VFAWLRPSKKSFLCLLTFPSGQWQSPFLGFARKKNVKTLLCGNSNIQTSAFLSATRITLPNIFLHLRTGSGPPRIFAWKIIGLGVFYFSRFFFFFFRLRLASLFLFGVCLFGTYRSPSAPARRSWVRKRRSRFPFGVSPWLVPSDGPIAPTSEPDLDGILRSDTNADEH